MNTTPNTTIPMNTTSNLTLRGIPLWQSLLSTVVLISVACSISAHALVNFERNGVLWKGTYEGDTTELATLGTAPTGTTPVWSNFDINTNDRSVSGGVLTMATTVITQTQSWSNDFGMTQSNLMTAEWRASVNTAVASDPSGAVGMLVVADGLAVGIAMLSDRVWVTAAGSFVFEIIQDMSVFSIYRMTYDGALSSDKWKLFINENPTAAWESGAFVVPPFAPVTNRLIFGDYSTGGFFGSTNWDYNSWTDAGAFAPVPEANTAMLVLATLGSAMMLRRFRRVSV
jgi:hypothetical protein